MIETADSRRARLKRNGRILLVIIFILLRVADAGLVFFSWHEVNPWPLLRGLAIGSPLWTTVLLGFVWMRRSWARYALIAVVTAVVVAFPLAILTLMSAWVPASLEPTRYASIAVALYGLCLIVLVKADSIHRLASPLGGLHR